MASQAHILALPSELRVLIYQHYLYEKDGYSLNHETQNLTRIENQPIDLALMYTCKLIAQEMKGLAFNLNLITLSTFYSDSMSARIGKYEKLLKGHTALHRQESRLLTPGWYLLDNPTYDEICRNFPGFKPVMDCMRSRVYANVEYNTWGESETACQKFITETVRVLSQQSGYDHKLREETGITNPQEILSLPQTPWIIPDTHTLDNMARVLDFERDVTYAESFQWKFRLSAASVAIRFLTSLPAQTRHHLRNILLLEDKSSSVLPETHAQGLIDFCRENPRIRIERRVSIWRAIWTGRATEVYSARPDLWRDLSSHFIIKYLGRWLAEAVSLAADGMPSDSFKLTLDADGAPDLCAAIFQEVVQNAAARQSAIKIFYARNPSLENLADMRRTSMYVFAGFPKAVNDITNGNSCIQCNFNPGTPVDLEKLMADHPDWTDETKWRSNGIPNSRKKWDLRPTLPSYDVLIQENLK